jgi:hypothetical protein
MLPLLSFVKPTSTLAKCSLAFATKCEENQQERFCAPCGLTFQPFSSNFYLVPGHSPSSFKTMSHQFTSGAFFNGEAAWHKLGTVLDGTLPAREAFAIANADWEVLSTPIFDPAGQPIAGYQAISRGDDGKVLSVQKDSYTIVQNEQLIKLAEALHEDASNGMQLWCLTKAAKLLSLLALTMPCEKVFADQLAGTVNDKRGDKTTARAKTLQDLPAWNGIVAKFHGEGIGSTIKGVEGTMWGAYNAITEHLTHDAGRATSDTVETARKRLESLYWGTGAATLAKAHALALA